LREERERGIEEIKLIFGKGEKKKYKI